MDKRRLNGYNKTKTITNAIIISKEVVCPYCTYVRGHNDIIKLNYILIFIDSWKRNVLVLFCYHRPFHHHHISFQFPSSEESHVFALLALFPAKSQ